MLIQKKITNSNKKEIKVLLDVNPDIKENEIYFTKTKYLVIVDFKYFIYYLKQNNIKTDEAFN